MADSNGNGINDTLVIELETINPAGTFVFVINLLDKNGILTNETNKTLNAGVNKVNITFSSLLLSQEQFNYSIKVYNSSRRQKFRKDNIPTQIYSNYEEGFRVLDVKDSKIDQKLRLNITVNSPKNETHITTIFLNYINQSIFSKSSKTFRSGTNYLIFDFDNETVKRTHYTGNFSILSIKIGRKTYKTDFATSYYNYRDFAASAYIFNFTDDGVDLDNDGKFDFLEVNPSISILRAADYTLTSALYDLFGAPIEASNVSMNLDIGNKAIPIRFNGTNINEKKVNVPFVIKHIELYENGVLIDKSNDAYVTKNYNFNDFQSPDLPDLTVKISASDAYKYGIGNITINITFSNMGKKHAFNIFTDIFDNKTFSRSNKTSFLGRASGLNYQLNFANVSDFEITAAADLQNLVEESNESNNAEKIAIKMNKRPNLAIVKDTVVNETDKIIINLSASDPNDDELSYSINFSKFSNNISIFKWNTKTTDSGNYTLTATASDGFLEDAVIFKISVLDVPEIDADNDGVNDTIDNLIGDENSVNTSTLNLTIFLGDSKNLSRLFNGSRKVKLIDGNFIIAEFDFDFSQHRFNLKNLTINKQKGNTTGSLIVRGLALPQGRTKILYLDKISTGLNGICIKEEEISSINEISSNCNLNNEFKVECDGSPQNSYTCIYNSTLNKYKIQGLLHSGIIQIDYTKPASESSSSPALTTGSSGGGGAICISDWQCGEWLQCMDGFQNRKCSDKNQCAFPGNKPIEMQKCAAETRENPEKEFNPLNKEDDMRDKFKNKKTGLSIGITGQVVKFIPGMESISGIVGVFAIILVLAASYLAIKSVFSKIFK